MADLYAQHFKNGRGASTTFARQTLLLFACMLHVPSKMLCCELFPTEAWLSYPDPKTLDSLSHKFANTAHLSAIGIYV